jgi:hypothetical protein
MAYNALRKKMAEALLTFQKNMLKEEELIPSNRIRGTEAYVRTLHDLQAEKIIDLLDGEILITNQEKLKHIVRSNAPAIP